MLDRVGRKIARCLNRFTIVEYVTMWTEEWMNGGMDRWTGSPWVKTEIDP